MREGGAAAAGGPGARRRLRGRGKRAGRAVPTGFQDTHGWDVGMTFDRIP